MKHKNSLLAREEGIVIPLFVVFLIVFLLMSTFVLDLSRIYIFRHELMSVADSISLAGASCKTKIPVTDSDGNTTGFKNVIDTDEAMLEAQSAMEHNRVVFYLNGMDQAGKVLTNWEGHVVDQNIYSVTVWGQIDTVMMGRVMRVLGDTSGAYDHILVKVVSESKLR